MCVCEWEGVVMWDARGCSGSRIRILIRAVTLSVQWNGMELRVMIDIDMDEKGKKKEGKKNLAS